MLRRWMTPLTLLTAVATQAGWPNQAPAASTTNYGYYELVNTRSTTLKDLVVTDVVPPNSVSPPDPSTSPLTILDGSFGFDPKNLQVFLSPADPTVQGLAINFANGGLAPGGTLNFKLSLATDVNPSSPPTLQLQDPDTDLKLVSLPSPVASTPTSTNPGAGIVPTPNPPSTPVTAPETLTNTPEPASVALWVGLAGVGLWKAGQSRRGRVSALAVSA